MRKRDMEPCLKRGDAADAWWHSGCFGTTRITTWTRPDTLAQSGELDAVAESVTDPIRGSPVAWHNRTSRL